MKRARVPILAALVLAVAALYYFIERPAGEPGHDVAPVAGPIVSTTSTKGSPEEYGTPSPEVLSQAPVDPRSRLPSPAPFAAGATPVVAGGPRPTSGAPPAARRPTAASAADVEALHSELDRVRSMIRDYRTIAGENPVGTNAEITKALMGGNKKGAQLGPSDVRQLNAEGELIDPWGTPYFFHQLSRTNMEIRSAGPDGVMWTADDQVTK